MNTPLNTEPKYGTAEAVAFLNGTAPDAIGRTIEDYLAFDADKWEECHNHVQWAFPNNERSMFNPDAPVVDMVDLSEQLSVQGIRNIEALARNYLTSLGLTMDRGVFGIDYDSDRLSIWLTHPRDHNLLRLTRLLHVWSYVDPEKALALLGTLADVAKTANNNAMMAGANIGPRGMALVRNDIIGADTMVFWINAALGRK